MPEMTDTETAGRKPKKKKNKESHNAVERHRKEKINAGINRIGNLLPCSQALKQSKNMILDQAFRYITELKKQNDTMLLEGGDKVQAEEICRLRRQLEELRKESAHYIELLKAHDINLLEDPTVHWKGKQRCAKVAKVTPTHQLPKGIIVYSNGNVASGKEASPGKQTSDTLILQPPSDVSTRLRVNGTLLQVEPSSTAATVPPSQSTTGLTVVEQIPVVPSLPPSVSYITLQLPTQPNVATSACPPLTQSTPVSSLTTLAQTVTKATATQDMNARTVGYTTIRNSQALLRAGAAGSTQTTWTTLQMAGNTVQPVCQSLGSTTQAVHQVTVCPPPVQPIQIHMQPPVQQAPITAHIQARTPQLRPAIQTVLAPQPQCSVLPQSAIVPQPAVVAHPAIVSQPQPAVLQPASLVPHPPAALLPQPQPVVPQQQAAVLPLLQTMQVLQVNPSGVAASAPQNTNNASVVILQQANSCPSQPVIREDKPTPCQHIVIIQAPNQAASAPQTPQVGLVPASLPAVSTQTPSSSTATVQSVGGKQLVHILPRPAQPTVSHPPQHSQAATGPGVQAAPQTITVNGQLFALQPMKTSDKSTSQGGQSTIQLVQPTTTEEPTTNVALNSLGALSSLNQSISQGLPLTIASQSNGGLPPAAASAVVQQQQAAPLVVPAKTIKPGLVASAPKPAAKRLRSSLHTKRSAAKRTKALKKSELSQASADIPPVATAMMSSSDCGESVTSTQTVLSSKPQPQSGSSVSATQSDVSQTDTIVTQTAGVSATSVKPSVSEVANNKASASSNGMPLVVDSGVKQPATNTVTITTQSKTAPPSAGPKQSRCVVTAACTPAACTTAAASIAQNTPTSSASCPQQANNTDPLPCNKPPHSSTSAAPSSSVSCSTPTTTSSELRKGVTAIRVEHPEIKVPAPPGKTRQLQEEQPITAAEITSDATSKKDVALPHGMYTNLDDQAMEHHTRSDSPMSSVAGGGRGFSVASMLPQGHSMSASSASFGTFTFTSEQAEMLALAMLEQDSPGRRTGSCAESDSAPNNTASTNNSAATWEPPKVSTSKDKASTVQQAKVSKPVDAVKAPVHMSIRGQAGDVSVSGTSGSRHPQNPTHHMSYSQPQSLPQVQTQSATVASLSVNNLIRPSSSQQPYTASPSLAAQQASAPSPATTASVHISQASSNSPCSGAAQASEYTPMKTALLRAQAERQVKIISKRQAQEEAMLNTGKRAKPCPPPLPTVGHMDVKAADNSQMMVGQLTPSSSAMARIHPEGSLFSTNSFMSPVVRAADAHCPPEQNQSGVLHLPQVHPQHPPAQPGQHLGGNIYMKQQQQEQQRHHLYHLQHHLAQPDAAQRHSLHQRALQEQQQQQQKKRGLVRGGQTGSPAGMQQKQHHLEKQQQQHSHQQQATHQHAQQQQQQQHPPHQQQQHQGSHPQQHQTHQPQHQQHHQQLQQNSHSRHQQHLQQQLQQQQHFRHQEKSCDAQAAGARAHHSNHLAQQDHLKPGQDHSAMQRMMSSRNLEQQLISPPSNPVSRPSELSCAPSRQERHRVSSYSAEALIGKSSTSGDQQQRMALHQQPGRTAAQDQPDLRAYMDTTRAKASMAHNTQNRLPSEQHPADIQRVSECAPFKAMAAGGHQLSGFEAQVSRGSDMAPKSGPSSQRGPQGQQQGTFRMAVGPPADSRNRYTGVHLGSQGPQGDACHQTFMQSLLSPHLPEHSNHQRAAQCCPPVSMEYACVPSSADVQAAKTSSPSVPPSQKASAMRLAESNKGHISQVNANMHGGVRAGVAHPPTPHSSSEPGRPAAPSRPPPAVSQHSRHISRDPQNAKLRPGERPRSGTLRPAHSFEGEGHLPGGVLLGRPQPPSGGEGRRSTIVRFMADGAQPPGDNNLVPEQHLTQNFGFPFIPEGGMNPPPPINANSTFIPPVSQPSASRTPSLLPVEPPQNTLPSFYPSYSPAAHPSLPSDVTLQYFSNQMFTSPTADKASAPPPPPPLNNRFGSILSPPRPVGFAQASFPLLPDMPPMPIANSSGITPHISNFSLTSLFPEIATGMPTDGSSMPMSPLLSLANASSADASKQPNRPAHNISHILGHDGSSAV
ncbi:basic helix-loop-helix domain-containing protein USF3 [Dunckerocampus dactyliophorus]|uniref:basic helix-loop-helix domain-containing protein USF3 n=1 Tax=Dunckerocampus dactyliophorus TaxID=161453 RepID=UPI002406598E|nr:basic helix-loop-helix domain-containing protein USF3 [Dunckerocampus dactyliophorus]